MTLHEIETALKALIARHKGIQEEELKTLLQAGGWEEKAIQEALFLYRTVDLTSDTTQTSSPTTPLVEKKEKVIPDINLTTDQTSVAPVGQSITPEEAPVSKESSGTFIKTTGKPIEKEKIKAIGLPQEEVTLSLVPDQNDEIHQEEKHPLPLPEEVVATKEVPHKEEIPANLPIKPYDASPHVVPFSAYKEVFYTPEERASEPKRETTVIKEDDNNGIRETRETKETRETREVGETRETREIKETREVREIKEAKPTSSFSLFSPNAIEVEANSHHLETDTKIAILASVMLLAILFLLGYMYSNGRL